ncbi:MAG: hypothetical protein JSS81_15835 [Acidobacteria bacterium]|nr:hypothetical protein [Acidobacteriota bacterium]
MDDRFIPFIHNYCDRWCDRCPLTARCRVAEAEKTDASVGHDTDNETFWRRIAASFAEAQMMLAGKAEELGIDLGVVTDEEFARFQEFEDDFIENHGLTKLAQTYVKESRRALDEASDWLLFAPLDETEQSEMLEVVRWYHFFIAAKIGRGLMGILDFEGGLDEEQLADAQSDANGSIKIALIAVERSQRAWAALTAPENADRLEPLVRLLENVKKTAETQFPHARDFLRPGFDEFEPVM